MLQCNVKSDLQPLTTLKCHHITRSAAAGHTTKVHAHNAQCTHVCIPNQQPMATQEKRLRKPLHPAKTPSALVVCCTMHTPLEYHLHSHSSQKHNHHPPSRSPTFPRSCIAKPMYVWCTSTMHCTAIHRPSKRLHGSCNTCLLHNAQCTHVCWLVYHIHNALHTKPRQSPHADHNNRQKASR